MPAIRFTWCVSLPSTEASSLLGLADEYDSILEFRDPCRFGERLQKTAAQSGSTLLLHMGTVTYTRGDEVSRQALNSQPWLSSAFQKDSLYGWQREYRYVLMDVSQTPLDQEFFDFELGDCSDVLSVYEYGT